MRHSDEEIRRLASKAGGWFTAKQLGIAKADLDRLAAAYILESSKSRVGTTCYRAKAWEGDDVEE